MQFRKSLMAAVAILSFCVGCASFGVSDIKDAIGAKQSVDTVAEMVVDCVRGTPTEIAIADSFNYLLDLRAEAENLEPNLEAVKAVAGGLATIKMAGDAWVSVKVEIIHSGLECDPALGSEAEKVEDQYDKLLAAIEANEKLVEVFEWGEILAGIAAGKAGSEIVRLSKQLTTT